MNYGLLEFEMKIVLIFAIHEIFTKPLMSTMLRGVGWGVG